MGCSLAPRQPLAWAVPGEGTGPQGNHTHAAFALGRGFLGITSCKASVRPEPPPCPGVRDAPWGGGQEGTAVPSPGLCGRARGESRTRRSSYSFSQHTRPCAPSEESVRAPAPHFLLKRAILADFPHRDQLGDPPLPGGGRSGGEGSPLHPAAGAEGPSWGEPGGDAAPRSPAQRGSAGGGAGCRGGGVWADESIAPDPSAGDEARWELESLPNAGCSA